MNRPNPTPNTPAMQAVLSDRLNHIEGELGSIYSKLAAVITRYTGEGHGNAASANVAPRPTGALTTLNAIDGAIQALHAQVDELGNLI